MKNKPKILRWCLFAGFTFLLCVLLQLPAAWLLAKFSPNKQLLHNVSGHIWSGQADWTRGQLRGSVKWQFRPLDILRLRAAANIQVHSGQSQFDAIVGYGLGKAIIVDSVTGQVAPETLKYVADWQWPANSIRLDDVSLTLKRDEGFTRAQGQIQWEGGPLVYQYLGRQERMDVPSLKANLAVADGKLIVDTKDQREQKMLNLALDHNFMLDVQLTQRLLMNVPSYQGKAGLDTYVLSTRQPLIRGGN